MPVARLMAHAENDGVEWCKVFLCGPFACGGGTGAGGSICVCTTDKPGDCDKLANSTAMIRSTHDKQTRQRLESPPPDSIHGAWIRLGDAALMS